MIGRTAARIALQPFVFTALAVSAFAAQSAPPNATSAQQDRPAVVRQISREALKAPPLEEQVRVLSNRVAQLESEVRSLRRASQARVNVGALAERLAVLESVLRVQGNQVELRSPGQLTVTAGARLRLAGTASTEVSGGPRLKLRSSGRIEIESAALKAEAAMVEVPGLLKASNGVFNTIVSGSYTPGAGNIW